MNGLRDLSAVMESLKTVSFHVKECTAKTQYLINSKCPCPVMCVYVPVLGKLPQVTLTGDHNKLHVTYSLPSHLIEVLPEELGSDEGLSLTPVLFNNGLTDINESTEQYKEEQKLNENSFMTLRHYYRGIRYPILYNIIYCILGSIN